MATARVDPITETQPPTLVLLPGDRIGLALEHTRCDIAAKGLNPRPGPYRPGRQCVTLNSHHATLGVSRCASNHAATSRVSHIKAAPLRGTVGAPAAGLCAGGARPTRARRCSRSFRRSASLIAVCRKLFGAVFLAPDCPARGHRV